MNDWTSPDYWLSFVGLPAWIALALAGVGAAWYFFGMRGALAAAAGLLALIAYRRGRDTQRAELTSKIRTQQDKSEELIHGEAYIARERARAAGDRVRREGSTNSSDSGQRSDGT